MNPTIPQEVVYYLHQYYEDHQHPASANLFFARLHPWQFLAIVTTYLTLVTRVIPWLMRDREPFVLKWPILAYNTAMVAVNYFFFVEALKRSNFGALILVYDYPDPNHVTAKNMDDLWVGYFYYCSKFLDWFDTMFFALRKKQSHLSFLHLYHHSMVPTFGYLLLRINPFIPALYLFAICNTFIHVIMYSYYALSVLGPKIQPYLWWKKYITQLQLGQFVVYVLYCCLLLRYQTGYPTFWLYFGLTQPPFFLWMFHDFYKKAYTRRPRPGPSDKVSSNEKQIVLNNGHRNGKVNGALGSNGTNETKGSNGTQGPNGTFGAYINNNHKAANGKKDKTL